MQIMTVFLLVFSLFFPFLYKYSFVITNQFSQIPLILSFLEKNYLPNDWYVALGKSFGPRTIFAFYMAQTAKIFSLPLTFFLHYVLYIFLIAYTTYQLSFLLFRSKFIALTTCVSILFGTSITLGSNILVTSDFSAPQLPLGLSLLGIIFLLKEKYIYSLLTFTLTSYFHPHFGFEATFLFSTVTILTFLITKANIISVLRKVLFPYFFLTLPLFFLYINEFKNHSLSNIEKINILAFMRNPHHYVPSSWNFSLYWQFFLFLGLFGILLFSFQKKIKPFFLFFLLFSLFFILNALVLGFLFTEIIPFYLFVALQPFRLTLYLYWLGAVFIIGSSLTFALNKKGRLSSLGLLFVFLSNFQIFKPTGKSDFLALFLALFLFLFFYKIPRKIFLILLILYFSIFKLHQTLNFSSYILFPTPETNIALWAAQNTPLNSIFLVPPEFEKFRLIAQRAIVADWKSFPFQEKGMREWAERMCDLGNLSSCNYRSVNFSQVRNGFRTLTILQILKLQEKYGFDYLVSETPYPQFKNIYRVDKYYVYKLPTKSL